MMMDYQIWKDEAGKTFTRMISIGHCPHCHGYELACTDVPVSGLAPERNPYAVACGCCGATGPWGATDELAITRWNATTGTLTEYANEWEEVPAGPFDQDDYPF